MGQLDSPFPGRLFILTGQRGVGKTTFLQSLLHELEPLKLSPGGVISLPIIENEQKIGIGLQDLRSNTTKTLASLFSGGNQETHTRHWSFSQDTLRWGNEVLATACPCDLLIVDELGPLELERGEGLQNGIAALSSRNYRSAVVVIRPELIPNALQIWPITDILTIERKPDPDFARHVHIILSALR